MPKRPEIKSILIIGSGGREHTLSWKVKQSKSCDNLFITPGNAGTAKIGKNVNLDPNSNNYIAKAIGDSYQNIKTDSNGDAYLQSYGNYPRKSKYPPDPPA